MNYSASKGQFLISTDKRRIDPKYVHAFLTTSYWSPGISINIVRKSIKGSLCFGIYHHLNQIGFARLITDSATFAYLADVFIDEKYRGKGLSKWLLEAILAHPDLPGMRRIMLATRDAHGLYQKFGFIPLTKVERWMVYDPGTRKSK
ncbi:MAG: GNAT family N-acetyltransferase [Ginsengibacter sp.]